MELVYTIAHAQTRTHNGEKQARNKHIGHDRSQKTHACIYASICIISTPKIALSKSYTNISYID